MAKTYGGRWEIVRSLRPGGQAETFVVRDISGGFEGEYVLKRIRNPERHGRFKAEVEALKVITHPNVVRLVDADIVGDKPYLVMEFCEAGSLEQYPRKWREDPAASLELFASICDGVAAAHALGITHRDIKPANILLRAETGPTVVADFGIAYIADGERHTLTEEAVGARHFTAPELADGRADLISPRSDIYSLGKLLYWMLSGRGTFDREQHRDPRYDLVRGPSGRGEFEHVNRILDHMIKADPAERYNTAADAATMSRYVAGLLRKGVPVEPDPTAAVPKGPVPISRYRVQRTPVVLREHVAVAPETCDGCKEVIEFRPVVSALLPAYGGDPQTEECLCPRCAMVRGIMVQIPLGMDKDVLYAETNPSFQYHIRRLLKYQALHAISENAELRERGVSNVGASLAGESLTLIVSGPGVRLDIDLAELRRANVRSQSELIDYARNRILSVI